MLLVLFYILIRQLSIPVTTKNTSLLYTKTVLHLHGIPLPVSKKETCLYMNALWSCVLVKEAYAPWLRCRPQLIHLMDQA